MNCKFFFHSSVHVIQLYQDCRRLRANTGWDTQESESFHSLYHSDLQQILILVWNVHTLTWSPAVVAATPQYRHTASTETRHSQDVIGHDERSNPERLVWIANESKDITTHTHTLTHNNMWRTVLPPRTSTASGNCCSTVVGLSVCIYILQHHCWFRLVALKAKPIASTITQSSAVSMQRPRPP